MTLETGIPAIDQPRHRLVEAMSDFFQVMDDPKLSQHMVAERTGAIFSAMKAAFAAEDTVLRTRPDQAVPHQEKHVALQAAYVDLCKKLVPAIKSARHAQKACLEIYSWVDHALYPHVSGEAVAYKQMMRKPPPAG